LPVHPHVHGELPRVTPYAGRSSGSSPRAWGTLMISWALEHKDRFIPTCMGNSNQAGGRTNSNAVHPHVHGELRAISRLRAAGTGSSPRAWGTLPPSAPHPASPRFIPTCMGNSTLICPGNAYGSVHPHVHGELDLVCVAGSSGDGSSPRAWGTREATALVSIE